MSPVSITMALVLCSQIICQNCGVVFSVGPCKCQNDRKNGKIYEQMLLSSRGALNSNLSSYVSIVLAIEAADVVGVDVVGADLYVLEWDGRVLILIAKRGNGLFKTHH
jgi:hypothetical protein